VANAGMTLTYDNKGGVLLLCDNLSYYNKGIISWYGAGNLPSLNWGDLVATWYVEFQHRR